MNIVCNRGTKVEKTCNTDDEQLEFLTNHMSNHHHFAQHMIKKHGIESIRNRFVIFDLNGALLYIICGLVVFIALIAFSWCKYNVYGDYQKI